MSKINKVLYNVDQRDSSKGTVNTREEMWMARNNIGLDEVIGHATVTENNKEYKGIAPLGTNGLVPAEFLPSFVNAVVNGYYYNGKFYQEAAHTTEISPDENTTYVDITVADVGVGYRWTQESGYFQISSQNAFGALKAGNDTIHADQPMDLLTITGQSGVTVSVGDSSHSDTLTIGHSNSVTSDYIGEMNPTTTTISDTFNLPWAHYDDQGHITDSGSNEITIQSASTTQVGVTQLVSTAGTSEDKAVTQKGVQAAIDQLDASQSDTGTNVTVTVVEEDGKLKSVTVTDDTATASHTHGNITNDGKVTTAAASKKAMLITNSSDQVVAGPAFGTAIGDDNLFLNKNGNWSGINEASADAFGGIKIGYTKNATKYPVELSDGKAYVNVDDVASVSHTHGNITNDGKIGSVSGKPLITTTDGTITTGTFGTSDGTFCAGNDARVDGAVRYDVQQNISEVLKQQARYNIGATAPYTISTGLTYTAEFSNDGGTISVTWPVPAPTTDDNGKYLKANWINDDGGKLYLSWDDTGSGDGDVVGPSSAANNHVALFDGTTGKLIKNSKYYFTDQAESDTAESSKQIKTKAYADPFRTSQQIIRSDDAYSYLYIENTQKRMCIGISAGGNIRLGEETGKTNSPSTANSFIYSLGTGDNTTYHFNGGANYATTATTASKIDTSSAIGSTSRPVYVASDGTVTACKNTFAFTDANNVFSTSQTISKSSTADTWMYVQNNDRCLGLGVDGNGTLMLIESTGKTKSPTSAQSIIYSTGTGDSTAYFFEGSAAKWNGYQLNIGGTPASGTGTIYFT